MITYPALAILLVGAVGLALVFDWSPVRNVFAGPRAALLLQALFAATATAGWSSRWL